MDSANMEPTTPKVFISYSWTTQQHRDLVKDLAERMMADGVEVLLDIYDLKEGDDEYAFMERMVNDPTVTNVLVISDEEYSKKADDRRAGVGTESQIISKEVYESIKQSKFIPIVCQFNSEGEPFLPTFLKSRIWINLSSDELINENWEGLIRLLFGKPLHQKPKLGKPPLYVVGGSAPSLSPITAKFNTWKQAAQDGKPIATHLRSVFLDACIDFADDLRTRTRPEAEAYPQKILADFASFKEVRNRIVDWILIESSINPSDDELIEVLRSLLERLLEIKSRPRSVTSWNEDWFEAQTIFVYETFLYLVAALLKNQRFALLGEIFKASFLPPESERNGVNRLENIGSFYGHASTVNSALTTDDRKYKSAAAEVIKRHADRKDITFTAIMEAELLVQLMSFLDPEVRWFPQTLLYADHHVVFPFFTRAMSFKGFGHLATITGIGDVGELKVLVEKGMVEHDIRSWHEFHFTGGFQRLICLDHLNSCK